MSDVSTLPALRRVVAGALNCIAQGREVIGPGDWEVEEVMDHLTGDVTPESVADLRQLIDDWELRKAELRRSGF